METEIKLNDIVLKYNPIVYFDETNKNWNPNPEYNIVFLRATQNWLNAKYKSQGHLFLNEVYDTLGLPRTGAGAVLGWIFGQHEGLLLDFVAVENGAMFSISINPMGIIVDEL